MSALIQMIWVCETDFDIKKPLRTLKSISEEDNDLKAEMELKTFLSECVCMHISEQSKSYYLNRKS